MVNSKDKDNKIVEESYHSIIGLGKFSARKSYFPELQKKIEELKIEKNKYQRIFTEALHGIFQMNLAGKLIEANPAMIALLEDESLQSLISRINDFRLDLFLNEIEALTFVDELKVKGSIKNYETRIVTQTGNIIDISVNALYQTDLDRNYIECFVQDITERKKTELELQQYREELEGKVKERTAELEKQNIELEKFNKLFIGREFRIKELREKLKKLENN